MQKDKRVPFAASMMAVALLATACADDGGGGSAASPTAEACTSARLKGLAIGAQAEAPSLPGGKLVSAGGMQGLAQAKKTVKLGFFGDLTGANSGLVIPPRNGAQLAIEQANEKGTLAVNVEFVPKDNKDGSADTAPAIEQSFIDDPEVVGVIGGTFSGETLAVGSLFDAAGLTHVTPSATNPDITKKGWPIFRALSTDEVQGTKAAELLKNIGCTSIAVIDDKTDYGKGLADFVEKAAKAQGMNVVAREGVEQKTSDYGPLIDTLRSRDPDVVFYGGYYNDGGQMLKQMRERGLTMPWMCGDGCKDNGLIKAAGAENTNGVILSCPCSDPNVSTDPTAQQFAADYKAKFGIEVGIYGAEGYDTANIFIAAIDASDDDGTVTRKEIFDFIDNLENHKGITKTFTFDETGEVAGGAIVIYAVKDGKIVELGQSDSVAA